jgi:hypothetical protein
MEFILQLGRPIRPLCGSDLAALPGKRFVISELEHPCAT